jgi:hypothetical protein
MPRGENVAPDVFAALKSFAGVDVSLRELAIESDKTERQVQQTMVRLAKDHQDRITVVIPGHVWHYALPPVEAKPSVVVGRPRVVAKSRPSRAAGVDAAFETVGQTAGEDVIVRGLVSGKLYKLTAL